MLMGDIKYTIGKDGKGYKIDSDGEKYRISFSEELQLKNLKAARENKRWLKAAFYAKLSIAILLLILLVVIVFIFYRLDQINFFTGILWR